jgi:hypothetical protein
VALTVVDYLFRRCVNKNVPTGTTMAMVIGALQAVAGLNGPAWVNGMRKARPDWDEMTDEELRNGLNNHLERVRQAAFASVMSNAEADAAAAQTLAAEKEQALKTVH